MRPGVLRGTICSLALATGVLATTSCTDETIVYRDRDRQLYEEPVAAAAGALGYSNQETKLTVCGNCHVGPQLEWETTAHADAWAGLQNSGHAQAFCEGCHTVSDLGNDVTGSNPMGWAGAAEERYHDVQCESCHGPGLEHVLAPADENVPWAPGEVGNSADPVGCGECHNGSHHPFIEQWETTAHATPYEGAMSRSSCTYCHTGEDALASWGIQSNWIEKDTYVEGSSSRADHMVINCVVCHDPHGSDFSGQLRFSVEVASEQENLCMKCHHKRGVPDVTTFRGPHSPQGPLLLGEAGYWPPDLDIGLGELEATHGSEANPRLCAGCHMNSYDVTDQASGEFVITATGHNFEATPCVDANGAPTGGDCAESEKNYQGCAVSGCHGSAGSARSAMITARLRLDDLAGRIEALLAQVPQSEFVNDGKYTAAEGARFNAGFAEFAGSGAHNPFLTEALMIASINQLKDVYGVTEAPGQSPLTRQLISDGNPDSFAFQQ